jgi:hypothetical protein
MEIIANKLPNDVNSIIFDMLNGTTEYQKSRFSTVMSDLVEKMNTYELYSEHVDIIERILNGFVVDNILLNYTQFDSADTDNHRNEKGFMGYNSVFSLTWHPRIGAHSAITIIMISRDSLFGNYKITGCGIKNSIVELSDSNIIKLVKFSSVEVLETITNLVDWCQTIWIDANAPMNDDDLMNTIFTWAYNY